MHSSLSERKKRSIIPFSVVQKGVLPQFDIAGLEAARARSVRDGGLSTQALDHQRGQTLGHPALDVLVFTRIICLVLLVHAASWRAAR
jgi:hypothetical protein